jgi:hypothetical protein
LNLFILWFSPDSAALHGTIVAYDINNSNWI